MPSPRRELKNNRLVYWYDEIQIQLAEIIEEYSWEKDIKDFAEQQKIPIEIRR